MTHRYLSVAQKFWAFALVALGMGTAWLADFGLFGGWGLLLAGVARQFTDGAKALEKTQQLRRVA